MLNCTDHECILHKEHYYLVHQHVLQMQHHLQDHREHHAMSSDPAEYPDGVTPQAFNETDPELSGHHLDAPNDSVYMICGVLIAMLLVAVIIVLLAITIK
ncbi:uncharacterized protein LOC134528325 isoform X2 [Bacillus rossius redtenbacheri]|uniref:uncharacterized protein LOC134528325 isoform X2 n=1 Tax=Bacillus rossius redtenbacheri TaxID=93214 RepID=UPI002FDDE8BB